VVTGREVPLLQAVEVLLVVRRGRGAVGPDHDLRERADGAALERRTGHNGHATRDRLGPERVEPGTVEVVGVGQRPGERVDVVAGQERLGQHEQADLLRAREPGQPRRREDVCGEVAGVRDRLAGGHPKDRHSTTTSTRWNSLSSV
jgi:hypothetical protein